MGNVKYYGHEAKKSDPCDRGVIGSRRIEIISIGSDRVFVGFSRIPTKSGSESDR
jgi:hypothetical protein